MTADAEPRSFVTLEDMREWITGSTAADWEVEQPATEPTVRLGPLLLAHPGPPAHAWRAIYRPRPAVRLLWGLERGRAYVPEWQPCHWAPAEPKLAELFFAGTSEIKGTSVDRYRFVAVDSGRCYLPLPRSAGASEARDKSGDAHWTITGYEQALFSLLNDLSGMSTSRRAFNDYLHEAAIIVTG